MHLRKPDSLELLDNTFLINGERAVISDRNRKIFIIDPGDWNRFRIHHTNKALNHEFGSDWFLASRGGGRQAILGRNPEHRNRPRRQPILLAEGQAVAVHDTGIIDGADLEGYDLPPGNYGQMVWQRSRMTGTTFRGAEFTSARGFHTCYMQEVQFVNGCQFRSILFAWNLLQGANFGDSKFHLVTFEAGDLTGADFSDCIFQHVAFFGCRGIETVKMPKSPLSAPPGIRYEQEFQF